MTETPDQPVPSLADTAAEAPEESVQHESESLADAPDEGPPGPSDDSQ